MVGWIVLLATLTSTDTTLIRIDRDRWPERVEKIELAPEQALWSWSNACAPQRNAYGVQPQCESPADVAVTVIGTDRKPIANAEVRWGTRQMLDELPDALLPVAATDAKGVATLAAPAEGALFARVAGPKVGSSWQAVARRDARLRAVDAAPVHIVCGSDTKQRGGGVRADLDLLDVEGAPPFRSMRVDGVIEIPALPRAAYVRLLAWGDTLAPGAFRSRADELPPTLVLPEASSARGRVMHGKEGVAAEIEVRFLVPGVPIALRKYARSAADGAFELRGIPPGAADLEIRAARFATETRALDIVAGKNDVGTFAMRVARSARLRIVDERGAPVAAAEAEAASERVRTDAQGICTLTKLPPDETAATIRARGHLPATALIPARTTEKPIDVRLASAATIIAEINRPTGQPAGRGVVVLDLDGHRTRHDFEAGRIEIDGLRAGTFSVEIKPEGATPIRITDQTLRSGETYDLGRLTAGDGLSIRAVMVDESGALPIAGARIRLFRPSATTLALSLVMKDWIEATTADDGSFEVQGLTAGPHLLLADAVGYATFARDIIVTPDTSDLGTLSIPSARELDVQCRPVSRCGSEARIAVASGHEWLTVSGTFDDRGLARIRPVGAGTYDLRLLRNDQTLRRQQAEISGSRPVTRLEIELPSTAVRGTVTRDGEPVHEGRVLFQPRIASGAIPVQLDRKTGSLVATEFLGTMPPRPVSVDVGFDGTFTADDFIPGDYSVFYRSASAESAPRDIAIGDGEVARLAIDVPSGEIRGRVTLDDGKTVEWAGITLRDASGIERVNDTRPDGTFAFGGVAPGKVTLRASNDTHEGSIDLDVRSDRAAETSIVMQPRAAAKIAVTVREENRPAHDATVVMRGNSGTATAIADLTGNATFKLRSAADVQLAAFHPAFGWAFSSPVDVQRGQTKEVLLSMEAGQSGALIVRSAKDLPDVEIFAPTGFPMHDYLRLAGCTPAVGADAPLTINGLPPGRYVVRAAAVSRMVDVSRGRAESISFP